MMPYKRQFVIAGAGGFGREVYHWLKHYALKKYGLEGGRWSIRGFIDDRERALEGFGGLIELISSIKEYKPEPDDVLVVGIGIPKVRQRVVKMLLAKGVRFETVVHPTSVICSNACLGAGAVVAPFTMISENVVIGNFVLLNAYSSVGHDAVVENFSELSPHVSVSGFCHLEECVFMGSNSSIIPGKRLGVGTQVAAGTAVMRSAKPYSFIQGVPGKVHRDFFKPPEDNVEEDVFFSSQPIFQTNAKKVAQRGKPFNVLFTCAGRRVELIRNFQYAMEVLGLQGGVEVTEATQFTAARDAANSYAKTPRVRQLKYMPSLLDIVRNKKINLIVPLTDLDIRALARQKKKFEKIGCEVMVGDSSEVDLCRNKLHFAEYLEKQNIPHIPSSDFRSFLKNPFFPCFVKPLSGSGSVGARRIENMAQLRQHVKANTAEMIIQPFVPGQEYTIDIYKSRSGEIKVIVPRLRLRVRSGEVEQGITVKDSKLIELSRRLCEAFPNLWGVFCAQCRKTSEGEYLFYELNPRFGGGAPLSIAAGANLPLYLLQDVLGLEITTDGDFQENLLMMRYPAAIFEHVDNPTELPGFNTPIFR